MKKYFKFSLIAVLLLAITGNVAAEVVTLRFKAVSNMGSQIYVYLYGRTDSDTEDKVVKDAWNDMSPININNGYFSIEYNNEKDGKKYKWINAIVTDKNSQQTLRTDPSNNSSIPADVKNGGYWIIESWSFGENIFPIIWPAPQAKNSGTDDTPQQPTNVYLGDKNLTFGCNAWAKAFGSTGSRWKLWISQTQVLYEGYPRSTENSDIGWSEWNEGEQILKSDTSAQFTAIGEWYWGIEVDYGKFTGSTYYATNSTGWTFMTADNELATKANLTVEVLPINNPQISVSSNKLSWTKNEQSHNVMVVKTTDLAWEPEQGKEYTTDSDIENVTIIQNGNTKSDTAIESGYIYKVYSVNNDYYSSGITIPGGQTITLTDHVTLTSDLCLSNINMVELISGDGNAKTLTAKNIYAKITVPDSEQWYFIGVPFAVKSITGTAGKLGDNDDYAIAKYDGEKRASGQTGWENLSAPSTENQLQVGGYIFWVNAAKVEDLTLILESGGNSITVSNSASNAVTYFTGDADNTQHNGWNFITNPLFSTATATLSGGQFHYAYDQENKTYTVSEGSVSVKPFDSYFVKTASEKTSVSFTSATATAQLNSQSVPESDEKVIVYLENGETAYSTKIRFKTNATVEYDELYDAPHLMSMSVETPQIYTLIRSGKMAINSIPEEASLALGVRVPQSGEYTIRWDSEVSEKTMQLHDQASKVSIDMLENASYTFTTAAAGEINDRFSISFAPAAVTDPTKIDNGVNGAIRILSRQNAIVLEGLNGSSAIQLYDLPGRHIHKGFTQGGTYQIPVPNKGIYVVEIKNESSTVKTKVICQ
jgi:hypothetical protein